MRVPEASRRGPKRSANVANAAESPRCNPSTNSDSVLFVIASIVAQSAGNKTSLFATPKVPTDTRQNAEGNPRIRKDAGGALSIVLSPAVPQSNCQKAARPPNRLLPYRLSFILTS